MTGRCNEGDLEVTREVHWGKFNKKELGLDQPNLAHADRRGRIPFPRGAM
jgi:hypothetical protein